MSAKDENKDYASMTVANLKTVLKDRGLQISGNKAELVKRLEEADKAAETETKEEAKEPEEKKDQPKVEEPTAAEPKVEEPKEEQQEESEQNKEDVKEEEMKDATKEEAAGEDDVKKEEEPEEVEAPDTRPRISAGAIALEAADATLNAVPCGRGGHMLMALCEGGLQYLFAGARANVGIKAGKYMFEVKVLEFLNPDEGRRDSRSRNQQPRQVVRVGLSTGTGSPILDAADDQIYFDSDGYCMKSGERDRHSQRFGKEQVVAIIVNLNGSSSEANTVSFFVDGQKACEPHKLPESLVGKTLFPTVTYKNVTLQMNFGPCPQKPLPLNCRMLQDAAAEDVVIAQKVSESKPEVLFPMGIPDQGVFDWVDQFLEQNPKFVELSDRKLLDWAKKSGAHQQSGHWSKEGSDSNNKPTMNFGISMLDNDSVQQTLASLPTASPRNLLSMDLKANLIADDRKSSLQKYPAALFKRVAVVLVGEPPEAYKAKIQELMLAEKVKKAEESKSKTEKWEDKREKDDKGGKEGKDGEGKDGEGKDGEGKEEGKEEGKDEDKKESDEKDVSEEKVELTEEEKAKWHRQLAKPDLTKSVLTESFASFSLPSQDEGFDEVRFEWQGEETSASVMKEWLLEQKKMTRVETLQPSAWFKDRLKAWDDAVHGWKKKQDNYKPDEKDEPSAKKAKKDDDQKDKDGAEDAADKDADNEEKGKEDAEEAEKKKEDEVDPATVEDIDDVGKGKPLYWDFAYEDWTLLSVRYKLHLLVHAYANDLADPERQTFHKSHLTFYYDRYYRESLDLESMSCQKVEDLFNLVKESASIHDESSMVEAALPADATLDKFVRLTEESRRERQRCIDAGDETARLKFTRPRRDYQSGSYRGSGGSRGQGGGYGRDGYRDRDQRGSYSGGGSGGYGGSYSSRGGGGSSGGQKRSYEGSSYSSSKRYDDGKGGGGSSRYGSGRDSGRDQRGSYSGGGYSRN